MTTHSRTTGVRDPSGRKPSKTVPLPPRATAARLDRLVEIADHCGDAKRIAEEIGEGFLAFLLSMVVEETQAAMRRENMPPTLRK